MNFEFDTSMTWDKIQELNRRLREKLGIDTDQLDFMDNPEASHSHFRTNLEA